MASSGKPSDIGKTKQTILQQLQPTRSNFRQPESKARPAKAIPDQTVDFTPTPPPPKPKAAVAEPTKQPNEDIFDYIFPPKEWMEGNQMWVQQVSRVPCTRTDVVHLHELLEMRLKQRDARETGICPVRRELYSQCFDELIRQVTVSCTERGVLMRQVRDEIQLTIAAYQTLYESSMAFGMRKALQAEQDKAYTEKRISKLENEKHEMKKQLNEEKAKCEAAQKREREIREVEEQKYAEEIQSLKKTIQQLKAQLEKIITPQK